MVLDKSEGHQARKVMAANSHQNHHLPTNSAATEVLSHATLTVLDTPSRSLLHLAATCSREMQTIHNHTSTSRIILSASWHRCLQTSAQVHVCMVRLRVVRSWVWAWPAVRLEVAWEADR